MTLAKCRVGQGPGLHNHLTTFETFTVLEGEFLIRWNDDGSEKLILKIHDTISIPPGVCRSFTEFGKEEGIFKLLFQEVFMMRMIFHVCLLQRVKWER